MKTKNNMTLYITTVMCFIPVLFGVLVFEKLPLQIPIHFDNGGNPDSYLSKALAIFGLPILLAAINVYTHFRVNNEPKINNPSSALKQAVKWVTPVISIIFIPLSLVIAMGAKLPIVMIGTALAGIVIVICGNYLPKNRQNYTLGIRLPWTLHSEKNWNKTNRFAGFVWVIGGLIIIANAFLLKWYVSIVVIALLVVLPFLYSFMIFKMESKESLNS
jgi:uncharacterized membrane protein